MPQNTPPPTKGLLYLVPAPLDFGCTQTPDLRATMPMGTITVAASLSHWICENAKSARAYLKRVNDITPLCQPIQAMSLVELPREVHKKGDHHGNFDARALLQPALEGRPIGLVSEAGIAQVRVLQSGLRQRWVGSNPAVGVAVKQQLARLAQVGVEGLHR